MSKKINSVDKKVRNQLTAVIRKDLYRSRGRLRKPSKNRFGFLFELPIFVQDPLVAEQHPETGVQEIEISWEPGLSDGPCNSRIVVVDKDPKTGVLEPPAKWNQKAWRFETEDGQPLDVAMKDHKQFHQVNAWGTVQRVLDYYESPWALGRPIPWGFEGNRLTVVPHAGPGNNAFYDRRSKSLKFCTFGPKDDPHYTCLSHDIVAHETGHAVLDGIRPYYVELSSLETAAFHEFIGDLTAILLALANVDVRHHVANVSGADLSDDKIISSLAEEFGKYVKKRKFLRTANKKVTMSDIAGSTSSHDNSRVLTSAMFQILIRFNQQYLEENKRRRQLGQKERSAKQILSWTYDNFRRIALQPLDLCPPADIRFIDYARAVLHNDRITNPEDEKNYRKIISEVFHEWDFCGRSEEEHKLGVCDLNIERPPHRGDLITGNVDRISRSRTAAYHFLDDNREELGIPYDQDFFIADLYETNKFGAAAKRLPREIVLEYLWREPITLSGSKFGRFAGQKVSLLCGGTIVFDGRGNIVSWFHKPGSSSPAGKARQQDLFEAILARIKKGQLAEADDGGEAEPKSLAQARTVDGQMRIEITPHIRETSGDPPG